MALLRATQRLKLRLISRPPRSRHDDITRRDATRRTIHDSLVDVSLRRSEEPVSPKRRRHRRCSKRRRGNGHRQSLKCHLWRRRGPQEQEVEGAASPAVEGKTGGWRNISVRMSGSKSVNLTFRNGVVTASGVMKKDCDASAGGQVHSSPLAHPGGGALPVGTQKALGHEGKTAASVAVA